jgi:hypothetical protein
LALPVELLLLVKVKNQVKVEIGTTRLIASPSARFRIPVELLFLVQVNNRGEVEISKSKLLLLAQVKDQVEVEILGTTNLVILIGQNLYHRPLTQAYTLKILSLAVSHLRLAVSYQWLALSNQETGLLHPRKSVESLLKSPKPIIHQVEKRKVVVIQEIQNEKH